MINSDTVWLLKSSRFGERSRVFICQRLLASGDKKIEGCQQKEEQGGFAIYVRKLLHQNKMSYICLAHL